MSTCIANGYILETSNSKKVNKVNERLRVIFNQILKNQLVSNIATMVTPIANYVQNPKSDCKERHTSYLECVQSSIYETKNTAFEMTARKKIRDDQGTLYDFAKDIIQVMSIQNVSNLYSVQSEKIYFKSVGNVTLYFFAVSSAIAKEFNTLNKCHKILKDYEYYDNSDMPDNVTTKAWKHRIHTWNRILGKSNNMSEVMYNIPLKVDLYDIEETDIMDALPDEATRLSNIYKRSRLNEIMLKMKNEHIAKHGPDISNSDYSNLYFEASELVSAELINGVHTTSQKHLEMLLTQEEFLNKIFYEEHDYFKKEVKHEGQ
jgi:hypothetical protein